MTSYAASSVAFGRSVENEPPPAAANRSPRRRLVPLALLLGGGLVAAYFATQAPKEQHVRYVLGDGAALVTGLSVEYVEGGAVLRDVRLPLPSDRGGAAPRIVSHEPSLADGAYLLRIDIDTREGRRSVERRVTLGGGTTSVDLTDVLHP
jgi:hypothetical protein